MKVVSLTHQKLCEVCHTPILKQSKRCQKCAKIGTKHSIATRLKISKGVSGEKNFNWNGGKMFDKRGYIKIHSPNHPFKDNKQYVYKHRLVMEKHLGRYLKPSEQVHHINGIKTDNRIENLSIVSPPNHFGKIICPHCLKEFLIK